MATGEKLPQLPESLDRIRLLDESKLVSGDGQRWIWHRYDENNSRPSMSTVKFPPSLMVLAMTGIRVKSNRFLVEETLNADPDVSNLDGLSFIEVLDAKHGPFAWIFQQEGAPAQASKEVLERSEESVDVIVDWPWNSPDLYPVEL
jgi:hypothetical protein